MAEKETSDTRDSNMSEKNSFDQLATEIFFEIFDYLSYDDILGAFFDLNQRFNSMLVQYHRFVKHFKTPTQHLSLSENILPFIHSRIEYLTITAPDFSCRLNSFPNVQSVIISSPLLISCQEVNSILASEQFKKLTSLHRKSNIVNRFDNFFHPPVLGKIFSEENSLNSFESVHNLNIDVNLRSLSLKLLDVTYLFHVLDYTPNLKYLNLILKPSHGLLIYLKSNIDLSPIKLEKLSLAVLGGERDIGLFSFIMWFVKQFSLSLNYLSLDFHQIGLYAFQVDGWVLQHQFLELMIHLKSFHFYAKISTLGIRGEQVLSRFRTRFWPDHQWTFGMHGRYL